MRNNMCLEINIFYVNNKKVEKEQNVFKNLCIAFEDKFIHYLFSVIIFIFTFAKATSKIRQ